MAIVRIAETADPANTTPPANTHNGGIPFRYAPVFFPRIFGAMQERGRILSIDFLRGLVMVIMALDHTRDYFHASAIAGNDPLDLATTTPVIFLTRWITHFCAPIFVFLSGLSAFLVVDRTPHKGAAAMFLVKRGMWLVLCEVTIVAIGWSFSFSWPFTMLQVIWAIGMSMIVLAAFVRLPVQVTGIVGLLIVLGHNALDGITISDAWPLWMQGAWAVLHESTVFHPAPDHLLAVGYPILPWIGVMFCGYAIGVLYRANVSAQARFAMLGQIGATAVAMFIVLRLINSYGDMHRWHLQSTEIMTVLSFLDCTKYPPSLLYTCMTIGPGLLLLAAAERYSSAFSKIMIVFGRVPFFYYLAHIYLIHIVAWAAVLASGFSFTDITTSQTFGGIPVGAGYSIEWVYVVWICIVVTLYPMCRWYDAYKTSHKHRAWLRYL